MKDRVLHDETSSSEHFSQHVDAHRVHYRSAADDSGKNRAPHSPFGQPHTTDIRLFVSIEYKGDGSATCGMAVTESCGPLLQAASMSVVKMSRNDTN